jgi:hypothetical protein
MIADESTKNLTKNNSSSKILIELEEVSDDIKINEFDFSLENKIMTINTKYPNKDLPIIMSKINELNLSIAHIEIKKTTLEQIFLKLTNNEILNK